MTSRLRDVQTADNDARQEQLRNDAVLMKRLPPREKLSQEIREPMIHTFFAGWKTMP